MTNLRALRLERGQSLRQLSIDLGVPFTTLSNWECGRTPNLHPASAKLLRDAFGRSVEWLLSPAPKTDMSAPIGIGTLKPPRTSTPIEHERKNQHD
jgi:transcriptional regulator with XRE-family HTH domain